MAPASRYGMVEMSIGLKIAQWRSCLADVPRLAADVWRYARYRRRVHLELERLNRGVTPIQSVGLVPALERVYRRRFPDRQWPGHWPVALTIGEDSDTLEMLYLALICRVAQPQAVFEIGTYEGRTANVMALHTPPDCRIYTLDLPPGGNTATHLPVGKGDRPWLEKEGTTLGRRLGTLPNAAANAKIETRLGDSATFDYAPFRARMDLVFVDGAHSYEYVMSDVRNALTMLAPRGFVLLHDLHTHAGVTLAVMTLRRQFEIIHVAQTSFGILFPVEV